MQQEEIHLYNEENLYILCHFLPVRNITGTPIYSMYLSITYVTLAVICKLKCYKLFNSKDR